MHLLIIPTERYLPPDNPLEGIFQRDQACALHESGLNLGVLSPQFRAVWTLWRGRGSQPRGFQVDGKDGFPVWSFHGYGWIPYFQSLKGWLWVRKGLSLFETYVSEQGKPELIHAHNAQWAGMLAFRIKKRWNIPYVLTEHSSAYARGRIHRSEWSPIKEAFRNAERRLMVSPALGALLQKTLGHFVTPWEWVPNVLSPTFEQAPFVSVIRSPNAPFRFLNAGALIEVKGQEILLRAFAGQFRGKVGVRLRIAGDGALRGTLQTLTQKMGISDQVTFLGELTREGVLMEMQTCDAYVHSSMHETFGVTLIEALSCGKPVISTACGGPECIVHENNGFLVPPGDPQPLAQAMADITEQIKRFDPKAIRTDCLSRFGQRVFVQRLSAIYEKALN